MPEQDLNPKQDKKQTDIGGFLDKCLQLFYFCVITLIVAFIVVVLLKGILGLNEIVGLAIGSAVGGVIAYKFIYAETI